MDTPETDVAPKSLMRMPGDCIQIEEDRDKVLKRVRQLLGWKHDTFPGAQPVSLTRNDLQLLFRSDYVVCEKTDGIRALLLAASGAIYLIGRDEGVYHVPVRLPVRGNLTESQQITLLDGEIVLDTVEIDGIETQQPRFMCYDGIYVQRRSLKELNFLERISIVYTDVIQPYAKSIKSQNAKPPLTIYLKDFFDISHITHIENLAQQLPHVSDGLIFTPVRLPYLPGTCNKLLKWKPPHLNTVDFSVDVLYDEHKTPRLVELFVMLKGTRVFYNEYLAPYGEVYRHILSMAISNKITQLIVECSWITDARIWTFIPKVKPRKDSVINSMNDGRADYDFDNGTWVQGGWYAERIRDDKKLPNSLHVVDSVKSSIEDDITLQMLVEEFALFHKNGKIPLYNKCIMPEGYSVK
ncbi:mRNA capping enzyme catalytic domain family protein [Babesia bovis T2Bo]|uniref:mRNA guanylyltransferase n=1 Tax=Babesia bovis TaxID=5865 RepID=A7ANN8_BABBO|nr:mRNA capping enzyme catalytic domain family protein [Babesia bovis T2Bo]EDO08172.1 mRNA capping enzyme catalytic domain family protein [Babesia bovis T2Bo]|eukprot:XP_001611740.1 mRNA capping enzyme, C-terminal domain containing protein [Babesia bovis T2Bo]